MASRLLSLPPELRNRIYEYVVTSEDCLLIPSICKHRDLPSAEQPGLTRVNRQLRKESLAMFYTQNIFTAHIHRCDFGFLIDWMNSIGVDNRQRICRVRLNLKDRWTCGKGLLDFFRWCVQSEGTEDMLMGYSPGDWNLEHREWMSPAFREEMMAVGPEKYEHFMGMTMYALDECLLLAQDMARGKKTAEWLVRRSWQAKLVEMGFECGEAYCDRSVWSGAVSGRRGTDDDFNGFCTEKSRLTNTRTSLAKGCCQY